MRSAPDSTPTCAPDSFGASGIALDSGGVLAIGIGAATDFFCAAKAAEGASPRTVEWYRMILIRAIRRFGSGRPIDALPAAELRGLDPRTSGDPIARVDRWLCPGLEGVRQLVCHGGDRSLPRRRVSCQTRAAYAGRSWHRASCRV